MVVDMSGLHRSIFPIIADEHIQYRHQYGLQRFSGAMCWHIGGTNKNNGDINEIIIQKLESQNT